MRALFHNHGVIYSPPWALDLNFLTEKIDPRANLTRVSGATRFNSAGVLEAVAAGVPRIDYDPVTLACRGLLIEEQRTNLLLRSADLSAAPWAAGPGGDAAVTTNAGAAPDGTNTACLLADNSAASIMGKFQGASITSGNGAYTASVFLKAGTSSVASMRVTLSNGTPVVCEAVVDLASGLTQWRSGVAGTSLSLVRAPNGWFRLVGTITDNATGNTVVSVEVRPAFAATYSSSLDFAATGSVLGWGAQIEAGAFATSYIPTTTAQATRAADAVTMPLGSWFNPAEGTLVAEFGPYGNAGASGNRGILSLDDGTSSNMIRMFAGSTVSPVLNVQAGGVVQCYAAAGALTHNAINRVAGAYRTSDFVKSANGNLEIDTSGAVPAVTMLRLGTGLGGVTELNGHLRRLRYYRSRLPNAQLQALTA